MSRKPKKHARTRARESALAILYSGDIIESAADRIVEEGLYPSGDINLSEYAELLVKGVCDHCEEIDRHLASTSENWALDRMPVVDRAILRLAVYEMLFVDEVPVSVAINEAVELAKAYGGEDESSRFVNGVLGKIARAAEEGEGADKEGAAAKESAAAEVAEDLAAEESAAAEEPEDAAADEGAEGPDAGEPSASESRPEDEPEEDVE